MKRTVLLVVLAVGGLSVFGGRAEAGEWRRAADPSCSADHFHVNDLVSYAEIREQRLPSGSENYINPGANGSIKVHGWNNGDVLVKACIQAAAPSDSEARALASQIQIARGSGDIQPNGVSTDDQHHWSLSYEVWVPNGANVKLAANNGSISAEAIQGQLQFHTSNGSVHLRDIGGDVEGSTTNGSLTVDVASAGWTGTGLHVETTNGSVRLNLPETFSAQVEVSTVNGNVRTDFPVTITGEIKRSLSFQLGSGGPVIEAKTVNGSVHIAKRT